MTYFIDDYLVTSEDWICELESPWLGQKFQIYHNNGQLYYQGSRDKELCWHGIERWYDYNGNITKEQLWYHGVKIVNNKLFRQVLFGRVDL